MRRIVNKTGRAAVNNTIRGRNSGKATWLIRAYNNNVEACGGKAKSVERIEIRKSKRIWVEKIRNYLEKENLRVNEYGILMGIGKNKRRFISARENEHSCLQLTADWLND